MPCFRVGEDHLVRSTTGQPVRCSTGPPIGLGVFFIRRPGPQGLSTHTTSMGSWREVVLFLRRWRWMLLRCCRCQSASLCTRTTQDQKLCRSPSFPVPERHPLAAQVLKVVQSRSKALHPPAVSNSKSKVQRGLPKVGWPLMAGESKANRRPWSGGVYNRLPQGGRQRTPLEVVGCRGFRTSLGRLHSLKRPGCPV